MKIQSNVAAAVTSSVPDQSQALVEAAVARAEQNATMEAIGGPPVPNVEESFRAYPLDGSPFLDRTAYVIKGEVYLKESFMGRAGPIDRWYATHQPLHPAPAPRPGPSRGRGRGNDFWVAV